MAKKEKKGKMEKQIKRYNKSLPYNGENPATAALVARQWWHAFVSWQALAAKVECLVNQLENKDIKEKVNGRLMTERELYWEFIAARTRMVESANESQKKEKELKERFGFKPKDFDNLRVKYGHMSQEEFDEKYKKKGKNGKK